MKDQVEFPQRPAKFLDPTGITARSKTGQAPVKLTGNVRSLSEVPRREESRGRQ